jgi:hypothetical protein
LIKEKSPTVLLPRINYKKLKDGYREFERLRPRVMQQETAYYASSGLQHHAADFEKATLDDVLSVLIEPDPKGGWRWDIILTFTAVGSSEGFPCQTREEAEERVLQSLGALGCKHEPLPGFEPVEDTSKVLEIFFDHPNGKRVRYNAPNPEAAESQKLWDEVSGVFPTLSADEVLAVVATAVLTGTDEVIRKILLTLLALCKWTHVTNEIIYQYCEEHEVDLREVKRKLDDLSRAEQDGIDVKKAVDDVKENGIDIAYQGIKLRADRGAVERAKEKVAAMSPQERKTERKKLVKVPDGIQAKVNDGEQVKDMKTLFHAMCDLHALDAINVH